MKYHYQFVSKTSARIELIPEKDSEKKLIASLALNGQTDEVLNELFVKGLANYEADVTLTETVFMNIPTVALCRFKVFKATSSKSLTQKIQVQ
ncbi:MAG: hypothetical protein EOO47_00630, partial [Flavobacterium sp.]